MGIKMKMARLGLKLKKNAPTICVVGGVTLMAVGTVFACKASRYSLDEALNSEKDHIKHIHEVYETYGNTEKSPYDKKDYVHDLVQCYTKTSLRVAKNYIVPALMFTAGAGLVFKGHSMMAARNAAIADPDHHYGWYSIREFDILAVPDGYVIKTPRPKPI